jgi:hypothetical protein
LIRLDVLQARQTVTTIQYKPTDGGFSYQNDTEFPFVINAGRLLTIDELGAAIAAFRPVLEPIAFYLASLLVEAQTEIPIPLADGYVFGSLDLLRGQDASDLRAATEALMAVRNPLRLFAARMALRDFFARYGAAVERYGRLLRDCSAADATLGAKLHERETDARTLAGTEPLGPFAHTVALMRELAAERDWASLRAQAERLLDSSDSMLAREATRMFALCLAQSEKDTDKQHAVKLYDDLCAGAGVVAHDLASMASVLTQLGNYDEAKKIVLQGVTRFPEAADGFASIGHEIVTATGDRTFRDELAARHAERRAM